MSRTLERMALMPANIRAEFLASLAQSEKQAIAKTLDRGLGSRFGEYRYNPVGFVHDVLREPTWSKMDEILNGVLRYKVTCVPAAHSVSKSHTAARVVAWWNSVHPPGTALTITTATTFQQVKTILWPHIRKMVARHNLPGRTNTTEWVIPTDDEPNYLSAYGFSANDNDEAAVQGRHAPHLLIVVDEAGGISHELGKALYSLLTGGHTRMLLIGNPSTEEENTWFQKRCEAGRANTIVIPIPVSATPNFTGEDAGLCASCPVGVPPHPSASHLVDQLWLDEVLDEFGAESAYVTARVDAKFPEYVQDKVLPLTWLENALVSAWPDDVQEPGRIRLGVDVASDGGDEFVIARAVGLRCEIKHTAVGAANENSEDVGAEVVKHILAAEALHKEWGIEQAVRVKVDTIGVGWGVVSYLEKRREEGVHHAEIVGVNVARTANDPEKFDKQRAEMWWNLRTLIQPRRVPVTIVKPNGHETVTVREVYDGPVRLDIDTRTLAQLTAPMYRPDGTGRVSIEKKTEIKKRTGGRSPDRGEAILLALYEPQTKDEIGAFNVIGVAKGERSWRELGSS